MKHTVQAHLHQENDCIGCLCMYLSMTDIYFYNKLATKEGDRQTKYETKSDVTYLSYVTYISCNQVVLFANPNKV